MTELYRDSRTFFGVEDDTWIALAIWSLLSHLGLIDSINTIFNSVLKNPVPWDTAGVTAILILFVFLGTMAAVKRMERRIFMLMTTIAFLWFFSFLTNENARLLLKMYFFYPVMVKGLCGILCIGHFDNWKRFLKVGRFFVFFGIAIFIPATFCVINGDIEQSYMTFSYNNLIFVVGAFLIAIRRKNILMWLLAGIGTIFIIITGCRGALVCVASYVVLEFVFNPKIHIVAKITFCIAVVVLVANIDDVMMWIDGLLKQFDYESRTIRLFFEGEIDGDSGRKGVFGLAWKVIKDTTVFGHGMAGASEYLFEKIFGIKPYGLQYAYAHNLFLELWMEYGIIFGTIISAWIIIGIVGAWFKTRKTGEECALYFLMAITLPKLMVTGTYLSEAPFFILLGLLVNLNCYTKVKPWRKEEGLVNDE